MRRVIHRIATVSAEGDDEGCGVADGNALLTRNGRLGDATTNGADRVEGIEEQIAAGTTERPPLQTRSQRSGSSPTHRVSMPRGIT
jgi:hypothetical protein